MILDSGARLGGWWRFEVWHTLAWSQILHPVHFRDTFHMAEVLLCSIITLGLSLSSTEEVICFTWFIQKNVDLKRSLIVLLFLLLSSRNNGRASLLRWPGQIRQGHLQQRIWYGFLTEWSWKSSCWWVFILLTSKYSFRIWCGEARRQDEVSQRSGKSISLQKKQHFRLFTSFASFQRCF